MRLTTKAAYQYMLGGKAEVTMLSTSTRNQFTFRVKQVGPLSGTWYVYAVVGMRRYYIGYIRGDLYIRDIKHHHLLDNINAFGYAWKHIVNNTLPDSYHIMHTGRCAACNRKLTDADSIASGFGPECRRKLGISIDSTARVVGV